jgi:tetratricopeptide (TPR) repeat protein
MKWFILWRRRRTGAGIDSCRVSGSVERGGESALNVMPSLIHLFLVIPFIGLSFTAVRFIYLVGIVSGPVIARNLSLFVNNMRSLKRVFGLRPAAVFAAVLVLVFASLSLSNVGPFGQQKNEFGFGFNYVAMPKGALEYMDKRNIEGRVFNLFQWGQFITWRDFPKRSAFVDGRGPLSLDLMEKLDVARGKVAVLDELYDTYGFESVLIGYPIDDAGVTELRYETHLSLRHPGWALVYWDDVSLLFLKRGSIYDSVIRSDEYRFVRPDNRISGTRANLRDRDYRIGIVNELERNIEMTGSSKAYSFLGYIYNETGLYRQAIEAFKQVRHHPLMSHIADAYSGIAFAYGGLGNMEESIKYYKKTLKASRSATTLYNIGIAYIKKGEGKEAVKYLTEALSINKTMMSIYPQLISIYQKLGMQEDIEETKKMLETARVLGQGEEHVKKALKAFFNKECYLAADEYKKSIEANPYSPVSHSNLGYIYYDLNMNEKAYEYQRRAIDIDPNFANAHYGLGLIYKRWGDMNMAKKHFQEYLRLEPGGYFPRRAKEAIEAIK